MIQRRMTMIVGVAVSLALGFLLAPRSVVTAAARCEETKRVEPKGHGKLVFVLTTGFEDLQENGMAIRQAKVAKESGFLDDVVLLVYGRAVQAFSKDVTAKPPQTTVAIKEAKAAGVRILICGEAIKRFNIPKESLDPQPEAVVPNAIVALSELVSKGYQIIKY